MNYKINARHLILDLLYASHDATASIKRILYAAHLLGISDNSVRVAVSRLNQENMIQTCERGIYQLVEKKFDTSVIRLIKSPKMQLMEQWDGVYYVIYTAHLGRVDRTALSKREKTLHYYGFKPLEQHLYLRPANLGLPQELLKEQMIQFGCEPEIRMFQATQFQSEAEIMRLWDIEALNMGYQQVIGTVQAWFEAYPNLALEQAAISAFYMAKKAIFNLRADPLLPNHWVNAEQRMQCEYATQQIEHKGQQLWQEVFARQQI